MDPSQSTRAEYTSRMTSIPIPDFAHKDWKNLVSKHQSLLRMLADHPAMAPNLQQTYSTPANNKNNVYFMWDFVGRTLFYCFQANPTLQDETPQEKEAWQDALTRAMMTQSLIMDTAKGRLNAMTESTYPEQKGRHPNFGSEIKSLARGLV
ncbi:hypothetical protein LTS18_004111 [Coniosporium uncinatum]|uniref:Uncharacterized protein n=1 Tax=Coniosporium uncinatum TaxID=93489 RepID=A0ACC3D624_9PEZI|nr:hypothetical protein LTS18_004111 [Coniosporium uncinatum]